MLTEHVNQYAWEYDKRLSSKAVVVDDNEGEDTAPEICPVGYRHLFFLPWFHNGPMSEKDLPIFQLAQGPGAKVPQPKGTPRATQRALILSKGTLTPDVVTTPGSSFGSAGDDSIDAQLIASSIKSTNVAQVKNLLAIHALEEKKCLWLLENGSTEEIKQLAKQKLERLMLEERIA